MYHYCAKAFVFNVNSLLQVLDCSCIEKGYVMVVISSNIAVSILFILFIYLEPARDRTHLNVPISRICREVQLQSCLPP
jgi:hypothetical protein